MNLLQQLNEAINFRNLIHGDFSPEHSASFLQKAIKPNDEINFNKYPIIKFFASYKIMCIS